MTQTIELFRIRTPGDVGHLTSLLSTDELTKASRFRFESDRNTYVSAHAALRWTLGAILDTHPSQIEMMVGAMGKPFVTGIEFSLSHSADLSVIAVGSVPVGIDVELIKSSVPLEFAAAYFSPREVAALQALEPRTLNSAFFSCWTRKEAVVKAMGAGLSCSLTSFDVSVECPAALIETRDEAVFARDWILQDLDVGKSYAASVCVAHNDVAIRPIRHLEIPAQIDLRVP